MKAQTILGACALLALSAAPSTAQTSTLSAGAIAFTGYQSDTPDTWSFVLLDPVASETKIFFTDNGWTTAGAFRANEGTAEWEATENLPSGVQITISGTTVSIRGSTKSAGTVSSNSVALSASGDQLLAYQGTSSSPTFLAAIQMNGDWDAEANSSNTSTVPSGLTDGVNALAISPEVDNAVYNCPVVSGAVSAVRQAINTAANWTTSNSTGLTIPPPCDFTVSECALMLGLRADNISLGNNDVLLLNDVIAVWEVTIPSVPVLHIPNEPLLIGLNLHFQVVMWNPFDFPEDPLQFADGLKATINGPCTNYGAGSGMLISAPMKAEIGKPFQPAFKFRRR